MKLTATTVCLFLAFIFFLLASFGVSARVSFRDLAFAMVVLAFIFAGQ